MIKKCVYSTAPWYDVHTIEFDMQWRNVELKENGHVVYWHAMRTPEEHSNLNNWLS